MSKKLSERRDVISVVEGKSAGITIVTLACGHRQVWETRTRLPKVGDTLWCSGCYSHGDSPANMKVLRRIARNAVKPEGANDAPF